MFFIKILRIILKIILFFIADLEIVGRENLPASGPYILVLNHVSKADAPLMMLSLPVPPMTLRYFAADKWRTHWFFGPILKRAWALFIRRGEIDRKAMKEAITALENGEIFGLAPEGTRSHSGSMMPAKNGAAYLASRAKVPIVPAGIINTDIIGKNVMRLRRTNVTISYGEPFNLPDLGRRARMADMDAFTHLIMVNIANLLPERYHGYYAGTPALAALKQGENPFPHCQAIIKTKA